MNNETKGLSYDEIKERRILDPVFSEKLDKILSRKKREQLNCLESEWQAQLIIDEQKEQYQIPSYLKPEGISFEDWRKGEGKMPF